MEKIRFSIQIKNGSDATGSIFEQITEMLPGFPKNYPDWEDSIWFESESYGHVIRSDVLDDIISKISDVINPSRSDALAHRFLHYTGGSHEKRLNDLAAKMAGFAKLTFNVYTLDAFRQISAEEGDSEISGKGLIKELRKIQKPVLGDDYHNDKNKFGKINKFLQELLGEEDAFLEIPAEHDDIYVSIKEKILPLNSLGTGIHQLIIFAAAVTIIDNAVFCIEEPEIHLHPELQKKFMDYIRNYTNNQYLISTHSNSFFDDPNVNIYHCKLCDNFTKVELVKTDKDKKNILGDLGYKASDILLANSVIWVEGPSDRIYLNHWIQGKDSSLIEGLHYSIMFYGGRLLSHLTYDSPEINEFIQPCKMNRNAAIIIDSDRESTHKHLNRTKKRVIKNFKENHEFVWVTNGRGIENYIPEDTFTICLNQLKPDHKKRVKWGRFKKLTIISKNESIDKVKMARQVVRKEVDYSILDLDKKVMELVKFIKKANLVDSVE